MQKILLLAALFSTTQLTALSWSATNEADVKTHAPKSVSVQNGKPISSIKVPQTAQNFSDAQLIQMDPWVIAADDDTVTISHALHKDKVCRTVPFPRSFFRAHPLRNKWYLKNLGAHRQLFEDLRPSTPGPDRSDTA